jgi:nucleotide-binding universal stress UspA family protein
MTAMQLTPYDLATTYAQVLMPVDFSSSSWKLLSTARHLAEAFHAPLRVVHVDTESRWRDAGDSRRATRVTPSGESVAFADVAERDAATGIVRVLGDDESSLLVMSTHGHSGIAELALGGTAKAVLRRWTGPLLTGGPQFRVGAGPIRRIVICVGPSATSTALLVDVGRWATALHARVELLSVTTPGSATSFSRMEEAHVRLQELTGLLPPAIGAPAIIRLQGHAPAHEIVEYADQIPGTLVAMATRARPAVRSALLGSVATTVLRNAMGPVLLRRADQPA